MTSGSLFCISDVRKKTSAGGAASPSSRRNISLIGGKFGRATFVVATDPRCSSVLSCHWESMRQRTDCSLQTSFITSAKKDEGGGWGLHDQLLNKTLAVNLRRWRREGKRFLSIKSDPVTKWGVFKLLLPSWVSEWNHVTHDSLTLLLFIYF